mmetsp:Transcript_92075/g.192520  ORF Transcript_92075/g.192520 Transcript_92075/m.192520 type:complete len:205 (-) Transcript_92075:1687-2301(-)
MVSMRFPGVLQTGTPEARQIASFSRHQGKSSTDLEPNLFAMKGAQSSNGKCESLSRFGVTQTGISRSAFTVRSGCLSTRGDAVRPRSSDNFKCESTTQTVQPSRRRRSKSFMSTHFSTAVNFFWFRKVASTLTRRPDANLESCSERLCSSSVRIASPCASGIPLKQIHASPSDGAKMPQKQRCGLKMSYQRWRYALRCGSSPRR